MIVNLEEIAILLATRTEACVKGSTLVGAAGAFQDTMELTTHSLADCLGCKTAGTVEAVESRIIQADTARYFWQAMFLRYGLRETLRTIMPLVIQTPKLQAQAACAVASAAAGFIDLSMRPHPDFSIADKGGFLDDLLRLNYNAFAELELPEDQVVRHHRRALLEVGRQIREEGLVPYNLIGLANYLLALGDLKTIDWLVDNAKMQQLSWILKHLGQLSLRHDPQRVAYLMLHAGATDSRIKPYVTMEAEKIYLQLYAESQEKMALKGDLDALGVGLKSVYIDMHPEAEVPTLSPLDYVYHGLMGGRWDAAAMSHSMATPMTLVNARINSQIDKTVYVMLMRACFGIEDGERIYNATQGRGFYDGRRHDTQESNRFFRNPRNCSTVSMMDISGRGGPFPWASLVNPRILSADYDGDMSPVVGHVVHDWGTRGQPQEGGAYQNRQLAIAATDSAPVLTLPHISNGQVVTILGESGNNISMMRAAQAATQGSLDEMLGQEPRR